MRDETRDKHLRDIEMADRYRRTWEEFIEPLFTTRKSELFDQIVGMDANDSAGLTIAKIKLDCLESIRLEFQSHMTTGDMARFIINKEG